METLGRSAEELARTGSVDIVLLPDGPPPVSERRLSTLPPAFVPAFPDAAAAQKQYFEQHGIFPILNVLVVREALAREKPAIIESICEAYLEAKQLVQGREEYADNVNPGPGETASWMKELRDDDWWPYGLTPNRKTLDAFLAASRMQELLIHRFELEDLFVPGLEELA